MFNNHIHIMLYAAFLLYLVAGIGYLANKNKLYIAALLTGYTVHSVYLVNRGWLSGLFISGNIFDSVFLLPWCMATIMIYGFFKKGSAPKNIWGSLIYMLLVFTGFALFYPKGIIPLTPNKITIWASLFFIFENFSQALFISGAWLAIKYLKNNESTSAINPYNSILITGFILYSLAQICGSIWCYLGWGSPFRWGSRHLYSAAIWFSYAGYLHLRFLGKFDNRKKAVYAIVSGLIVIIVIFISYFHEMNFERIGG